MPSSSTSGIEEESDQEYLGGIHLLRQLLCLVVALVGFIYIVDDRVYPLFEKVKEQPVDYYAISNAESVNMAMVCLLQSRGPEQARLEWSQAMTQQERYELLAPYLAYAPQKFADYMPWGFRIEFPATLFPPLKVPLLDPEGEPLDY